ncbi:MAG: hypothetical protein ABEI98_12485 [Halorhabdus sp.]
MPDWRVLGYGLGVFLGALAMGLTGSEGILFLARVPSGLVAAYVGGDLKSGGWYGFVIGLGIAIVVLGATLSLVYTSPPVPSVGLAMAPIGLGAVVSLGESVIAGAIGRRVAT